MNNFIELKRRDLDLNSETNDYKKAVLQIKRYLHPRATNCKEVKWAILTNANHIQLFRRHGRVIYPYTTNIELCMDHNVSHTLEPNHPHLSLYTIITICFYV